MQLGRINQLTIKRFAPPGAYLIDLQDNEVLLPNKYILPEHEEGSLVDVFVMKDSENRIVCTTEVPFILLGECKYLEVIHVNPYGAFVDWGLDKDLLVPFSEQLHRLEQEEKYLFTLRYDFETDRLFGSMKVRKVLDLCEDQELVGQAVDLLICEEGKLGRNVIVNNRYEGLIFKNQQKLNSWLIFSIVIFAILCLKSEGINSIDQNGAVIAIVTGPILLLARYFFNSQYFSLHKNIFSVSLLLLMPFLPAILFSGFEFITFDKPIPKF